MKRAGMDVEAMLAHPLPAVFGRLAEPARLGDWLPEVTAARAGAPAPAGTGTGFSLRLRTGTGELAGTGELIAHEPPWSVAYRLRAGPHTYILRLACTACGPGATRVRIHQADGAPPLTVDLARLRQMLAPGPAAGSPGTDHQHPDSAGHPVRPPGSKGTQP